MADKPSKQFQCPTHWTLAQRLDHYTDKSGGPDACWPWMGSRKKGYGYLNWKGKQLRISRLAWEEANGPIPAGLHVLHECDNPPCRNEAHLFLGPPSANAADRNRKGRHAKGERHGSAKLTDADVLAIRADWRSRKEVAADYGVGLTIISSIRTGKKWKHL